MTSLFGEIDRDGGKAPEEAPVGPFAAVALENSLDRELDYSIPPRLIDLLRVGQRVRVPLGRKNRPQLGYVVAIRDTTTYPRIKPLLAIDDERVLIDEKLMALARWMSRYYVAPLGAVIDNIIPSAVKRKTGIAYSQMVRLAIPREQVQEMIETTRARKRRAILARLLLVPPGEAIELHKLASEAGSTIATVRKLRQLKVITITPEIDLPKFNEAAVDMPTAERQPDIALNADQQKVFDDLLPRVRDGGFSVNLLHGVTGSGKTEVYLQCIRQVVERGRQAIVLVPEIALTPQTVRRFQARFDSVAILHSGLTATDRHRYWQLISTGRAQVIVGARSAIFAPVPNLGMIVVDEEHEQSYKQDQIPRYQARDVAIKRAQIEQIPILLGSATPSLETWWRVQVGMGQGSGIPGQEQGGQLPESRTSQTANPGQSGGPSPYHLLSMPRRVRDLQMPHVELIDMTQERRMTKGVHLLSQRLEHLLRATVEQKHQAILLLNRRGYSNFVFCNSCQEPITCTYCDATMTYHRSAGAPGGSAKIDRSLHTGQLHCHYCLAVQPLPATCPACKKKLSLFGLGTQRVEEEIQKKFPDLTFARVDSDSMRSSRDYEALLARFSRGEVQVLLGTQMIAKGLDFPNVTLVGVISGDTALALPDFRSAERTFQLITQVAGRAGRGDHPGRVVLQTFLPHDPTIQAALRGDYVGFATEELRHRREVGLPPYARMVRIIIREQEDEKVHKLAEEVAEELNAAIAAETERDPAIQIRVRGPMPCAISRIAGFHRHQVVLTSPSPRTLQNILANMRKKGVLTRTDRIAVDVDPVSLL